MLITTWVFRFIFIVLAGVYLFQQQGVQFLSGFWITTEIIFFGLITIYQTASFIDAQCVLKHQPTITPTPEKTPNNHDSSTKNELELSQKKSQVQSLKVPISLNVKKARKEIVQTSRN